MHAAFDAGVNCIDTAEVYGGCGGSERVVGAAVAGRSEVKVCTKVAPQVEDHFTEAGMRAALHASLVRLGRDAVDVYLLHWPAETTQLEEAWGAMVKLKTAGLVGCIGLSNFPASDVVACAATGELNYVQGPGSLLHRDELDTVGPLCEQHGVGFMAYGALGYGLLGGTIDASTLFADWRGGKVAADDFFCAENYARLFAPNIREQHLAVVDNLRALAEKIPGVSLSQLGLAWLLAQPAVTTALVGTRNIQHAVNNAAATQISLTIEQLARIAAIIGA